MVRTIRNLCLSILFILGMNGCRSSHCYYASPSEMKLPEWFTMPQGQDQSDTPVSMGIRLPQHLKVLAEKYELPNWVIYGVVRSLGAGEFLANGTVKTFRVSDELGEDSVVIDNIYYDVPEARIRSVLDDITAMSVGAENELERQNVLGNYVVRRFGGIILFSLDRAGTLDENLLLTTGETSDAMEIFDEDHPALLPMVGWRETSTHYVITEPGTFMYGNPVLAFRRTEEDAIRSLAKTLLLKLSHMRKSVVYDASDQIDDEIKEDVYCEEITLRMSGVRVLRWAIDVKRGFCLVEISVPRSGVARK